MALSSRRLSVLAPLNASRSEGAAALDVRRTLASAARRSRRMQSPPRQTILERALATLAITAGRG